MLKNLFWEGKRGQSYWSVDNNFQEDCILRYKKISAVIRQRKEQEENNEEVQQTKENQLENVENKEKLEQQE